MVAQAYGLSYSYLAGGATRSSGRGALAPSASWRAHLRPPVPCKVHAFACSLQGTYGLRWTHPLRFAWLALPLPAYGLQRPLSFLVLRALRPHRSVGLVLAAARFHRHYGRCLYRLPPLTFVHRLHQWRCYAPPVASYVRVLPLFGVGRSPSRQRGRYGSSPIPRAPMLALLAGGALPPLTRRVVWGSLRSPPFFVGYRFELRATLQGVSPRCSCPRFAPLPRATIARHLKTSFIGYRLVLRAKQIPSPDPPTTLKNATRAHPVLRRGASPPDAYNCSLRSQSPAIRVK